MIKHRQHWADLQPGLTWHGDIDEFVRLLSCVNVHCTCRGPVQRHPSPAVCASHELLADQSALDHLVFASGMRQRFLDAEWLLTQDDTGRPRPRGTSEPRRVARRDSNASHRGAVAIVCAVLVLFMWLGGSWQAPVSTGSQLASWQTR